MHTCLPSARIYIFKEKDAVMKKRKCLFSLSLSLSLSAPSALGLDSAEEPLCPEAASLYSNEEGWPEASPASSSACVPIHIQRETGLLAGGLLTHWGVIVLCPGGCMTKLPMGSKSSPRRGDLAPRVPLSLCAFGAGILSPWTIL